MRQAFLQKWIVCESLLLTIYDIEAYIGVSAINPSTLSILCAQRRKYAIDKNEPAEMIVSKNWRNFFSITSRAILLSIDCPERRLHSCTWSISSKFSYSRSSGSNKDNLHSWFFPPVASTNSKSPGMRKFLYQLVQIFYQLYVYFQAVHYRIPSGNPDGMPHTTGKLNLC